VNALGAISRLHVDRRLGDPAAVHNALAAVGSLALLVLGGSALGLAIAVLVAGGSEGAIFVGFLVLPLAYGAAIMAWRSILAVWLVSHLARSAIRSGGDEARFRGETIERFQGIRERGPSAVPGTWVFIPAAGGVGILAGLAMLIVADQNGGLAGGLIAAAGVGGGVLMRRLAKQGRLPLPDE
jgi:hypothetical protein